jgi:hypothetical protein
MHVFPILITIMGRMIVYDRCTVDSSSDFKFAVTVLAASLRIQHSRDRSSSRHLFFFF